MLFTSRLRRELNNISASPPSHHTSAAGRGSPSEALGARRRSQLIRRHTCSVLTPSTQISGTDSADPALLRRLLPAGDRGGIGNEGEGSTRQVTFVDPFSDKVVIVDTSRLEHKGSVKHHHSDHNQRARPTQRSSVGNVINWGISSEVSPPPTTAPPPLPAVALAPSFSLPPAFGGGGGGISSRAPDPWDDPQAGAVPPSYVPPSTTATSTSAAPPPTATAAYPQLHNDDDFDSDWSNDDDEEVSEFNSSSAPGAHTQHLPTQRSRSTGPDSSAASITGASGKQFGPAKMKTINRFSNFVKSGMESYILAGTKLSAQPGERHEVEMRNGQIEWAPPAGQRYTCVVSKPKKESKLKGLKSFIAYSLTSSLTGIQVSRRYKHFDWLHSQLSTKYMLIPIPPLPEKTVSGRYEDDLIEHRRCILQIWVNKICRHPVLSRSEVWLHFLNCTDDKQWKDGKRRAEKDEYVGGSFFNCLTVPAQSLDVVQVENQIDGFARSVRSLDDSIKELHAVIEAAQKRFVGPCKSQWQKIAQTFDALGKSFDLDQAHANNPVQAAIQKSAYIIHKIGGQHEEHGRRDLEPLLDFLYTYKGVFSVLPEIIAVHKSALSKIRDNERLQSEGRLSPQDAEAVRQRVDTTSYALLAEVNHLIHERENDMSDAFGKFFNTQAEFYTEMGRQMASLSEGFNK